jgi:hypothetical protein
MRIMEEILSMKIGIPHDANLDDNEEAEQMIRAITHGEIDNTVRQVRIKHNSLLPCEL